jgi:hypothetical protein
MSPMNAELISGVCGTITDMFIVCSVVGTLTLRVNAGRERIFDESLPLFLYLLCNVVYKVHCLIVPEYLP